MIRVGCVGKGSSLLCDLCLALLRDPRREGGDWSLVWLKIIALPALKRERMLESQGGGRASSSVFCVLGGALRIQEATSGWCTERKAKSLDFKFKQRTRNYSPFEGASQRRCFRRVSVSKIKEGQVDGSGSLAVPAQAPPGPTAECRMQTADCRG